MKNDNGKKALICTYDNKNQNLFMNDEIPECEYNKNRKIIHMFWSKRKYVSYDFISEELKTKTSINLYD